MSGPSPRTVFRLLAMALALAMAVSACGGDDDDTTSAPADEPAPAAETQDDSSTADEPATADDEDVAEPTPEPTATPEPTPTPPPEAVLPIEGSPVIELLTEAAGGGTRPLLSWAPLDGAGNYHVVVYDEQGTPYWAARTAETSIYVGGPAQIPEGVDGPQIAAGYSWAVYADDANGAPLGSSPLTSIDP